MLNTVEIILVGDFNVHVETDVTSWLSSSLHHNPALSDHFNKLSVYLTDYSKAGRNVHRSRPLSGCADVHIVASSLNNEAL